MSLLKTGRPLNKKEKMIALVKGEEDTMRMSINISKAFHKQIKQKALDEDTTVTEIVMRALKECMSK